jgi:hypothetical protein
MAPAKGTMIPIRSMPDSEKSRQQREKLSVLRGGGAERRGFRGWVEWRAMAARTIPQIRISSSEKTRYIF